MEWEHQLKFKRANKTLDRGSDKLSQIFKFNSQYYFSKYSIKNKKCPLYCFMKPILF